MTQSDLAGRISDIVPTDKEKCFGQSTVSGWENGKQLPPLPKLIALSEIFQCDISYLLCDYDKKKDISDISELTGLSERALSRLGKNWSRIQKERNAGWIGLPEEKELKAINTLLELDYSILINIHDYIFLQYDSFNLSGNEDGEEIFDKDVLLCNGGNSNSGTYISVEQMQSVFLLNIQQELVKLKGFIDRYKGDV